MATADDRLTREANATINKGARVLTPPPRTRPTTPAEQEADTVQVWPHLVVIEFLAAVIFTINLVLLGTLINGPLDDLANPDRTPNPSKAPWYFLNLQEMLLHMNPALAGVIVPTIALVLIAAIPYVDRGTKGLGIWFYNPRGSRIAIFTAIYSTVVCGVLIGMDKAFPLKANFTSWFQTADVAQNHTSGFLSGVTDFFAGCSSGPDCAVAHAGALQNIIETSVEILIPTFCLLFFPVLLVLLLRIVFKGLNLTEAIIGLFTGFVTVYFVLTFVGTAMRGPGMDLFPPWAVPPGTKGG